MSLECDCECGCGQSVRPGRRFVRGHNAKSQPSRQTVFPGDRFGQLEVLEYRRGRHAEVRCRCACGNEKWIRVDHLRQRTVSCGCHKRKVTTERNKARTKHGHRTQGYTNSTSPTYYSWASMNVRCYREDEPSYQWYGARGIKVCERWRFGTPNAFENFVSDLGIRPEGMELNRLDDTKDYEPGNVIWETHEFNIRNRPWSPNYGRRSHP